MARKRRIGSISRDGDGVYRVQVMRGTRSDGSRRRLYTTVHGTYQDAEIAAANLAAELGRSLSSGDSLTLAEYYWGIFRDSPSNRGKPRSAGTLAMYDSQMRRNILPTLGNRPISSITHADIKSAVLRASSPRQCKTVLRAVMRAAYDDDLLPERPMDRRIITPPNRKRQRRPWDAQEAANALDAMRSADPRIEAYLILGLSGLREEEALGMTPSDICAQETVDMVTGERIRSLTATVRRTYTDRDGLKNEAKNDFSSRSMPVLVQGRERLLSIISASRPADPGLVPLWAVERIVPFSNSVLYKRWKATCERLGLRFIPPDMLRHTSETLMQAAGLQDSLVSRLHGHTDLRTDYRHYLRPGIDAAERAAQSVHKIMPTGE